MEVLIIIILLGVIIGGWIVSTQRKLVVMDENINNAMSQIGVQLSSRFDALIALVELVGKYTAHEAPPLTDTLKAHRISITAQSAPDDVLYQENVISDTLARIAMTAERHPDLAEDPDYTKGLDAVDSYEKMIRTSRLIYNDSVTKLNHSIRMFPTSLVAGILGFGPREYLAAPDKTVTPRT